jgi:hypothetical protein
MKINEVIAREGDYENTEQSRKLAALGRKLMDMSATMPMKGASDDEIAKSNKMSALGDALTRWGTTFGPKNIKELVKASGLEPNEIQELLAMAQKAPEPKLKGAEPEPEAEPEDDFDAPDDDAIARQADRRARGK